MKNDTKVLEKLNKKLEEQKKEIKDYNKMLEQERKIEVPPVSEPLMLNLDLIFALAEEMDISDEQKSTISKMLHPNGNPLFLSSNLDSLYRFDANEVELQDVKFEGGKVTLPAEYISDVSQIKVIVKRDNEETTFDDWTISSVKRAKLAKGQTRDMTSITATYASASAKKFNYKDGDIITVEVKANENAEGLTVQFKNEVWKKGIITSPLDNFVEIGN